MKRVPSKRKENELLSDGSTNQRPLLEEKKPRVTKKDESLIQHQKSPVDVPTPASSSSPDSSTTGQPIEELPPPPPPPPPSTSTDDEILIPPPPPPPPPPIDDSANDVALLEAMGLPTSFDSTKGKHVQGNDVGAANIKHKRVYRQYMNRPGGFNRPLDPVP